MKRLTQNKVSNTNCMLNHDLSEVQWDNKMQWKETILQFLAQSSQVVADKDRCLLLKVIKISQVQWLILLVMPMDRMQSGLAPSTITSLTIRTTMQKLQGLADLCIKLSRNSMELMQHSSNPPIYLVNESNKTKRTYISLCIKIIMILSDE